MLVVTLAGAGGSGKSRLALALARALADDFANGTVLVDLAPLADHELVLPALMQTLGIAERAGEPPVERIAEWLRPRELMLVLDNFEHLLPAGPSVVRLLASAPRLRLVVTSRAVLHLSGEQVYPVQPLREDDALALLVERAQALDPRFGTADGDEEALRAVCRDLDGLPLAVELAAARARMLSASSLRRSVSSDGSLCWGRTERPAATAADASRDPRVEHGSPRASRTPRPCGALRLRGWLHARGGRDDLRRRARSPRGAGRPELAAARRFAVRAPLLDARDRARARSRPHCHSRGRVGRRKARGVLHRADGARRGRARRFRAGRGTRASGAGARQFPSGARLAGRGGAGGSRAPSGRGARPLPLRARIPDEGRMALEGALARGRSN